VYTLFRSRLVGWLPGHVLRAIGNPKGNHNSEDDTPFFHNQEGSTAFVQLIPGFILAAGVYALPFSPRWLASKGRDEEALD
jgi:hypothetical protein